MDKKWFFCAPFVLSSIQLLAAPRQTSSVSSREIQQSFNRTQWSLILPAVAIHGVQPNSEVASAMPRRLGESGDAVVTPGFGFEYKNKEGLLFLGAVVKDCFNNFAGTIQMGQVNRLSSEFLWGWSLGFYARQTPYVCEVGVNGKKDCYPVSDFPLKVSARLGGTPVEIMPMPFLHFSYRMISTEDLDLDLKVMGNFFINEVGVEIPF